MDFPTREQFDILRKRVEALETTWTKFVVIKKPERHVWQPNEQEKPDKRGNEEADATGDEEKKPGKKAKKAKK